MIEYSLYDLATGEVTSLKTALSEGEIAETLSAVGRDDRGVILGHIDPDVAFVSVGDAAAVPRPVVPAMAGAIYDLSVLPEGGALVVTDEAGFATTVPAQADRLELVDAGAYRVRSECPFPHVNFEVEVSVP